MHNAFGYSTALTQLAERSLPCTLMYVTTLFPHSVGPTTALSRHGVVLADEGVLPDTLLLQHHVPHSVWHPELG